MSNMEQVSHPVNSESRRYVTPRWWHKPFWFGLAALGIFVLTLWLFMRANLLPIDLVGLGLVVAVSIVVGCVLFTFQRVDNWLQSLHWLARGAFISGVLLVTALGVVILYKTLALWLPHFYIFK
jgi:hypothetical protein